jgi:iron complex transport system substrate-binding protein
MNRTLTISGAVTLALSALVAGSASASVPRSVATSHMCIVSLSPTATETFYKIGAGPNVEAVDTDSNFPTTGLPGVRLDPFNPNAEQIATICKRTTAHRSSKPDLVVIAYDANSIKEQLGALGVKVVLQDAPANLKGAYAQMTSLGALTGHPLAAAHLVTQIRDVVAMDVRSVPAHPRRTLNTYYELDPTLYSLTSSTFVGQLMVMLGIKDIADAVSVPGDYGYPQLSAEYLITQSPRLVLLADTVCCHQSAAAFAKRTGFATIRASRFGHVYGLNDDIASRWGPRLGLLMNRITAEVKATLADPRPWR